MRAHRHIHTRARARVHVAPAAQGFEAAQRFTERVLDACVEWEQVESAEDFKGILW